ncbi:hypothetical protein HPC38_04175 [Pasteurellaceae bacterium HPA106]|uniref:hypothetical protein n=1 Tax=Spirabiliibacterium pneumoniae TaxID=221400 RepID=UPI001AAD0069|nr:hypothetical protein [Spirabiliibacterium pneumoniae]MBE2896070.1 hypothetical protein [Spirabiliibacterium pneumoniae]
MKKYLTAVIASSVMLTGCATIMGEETQTVQINSNPDGATYVIKDEKDQVVHKGVTPSTATLVKSDGSYFGKKTYTIFFNKKGYGESVYPLRTSPNGWYIGGNIIFGGLVGWLIVDPLSGKMYNISPEQVNVSLEK